MQQPSIGSTPSGAPEDPNYTLAPKASTDTTTVPCAGPAGGPIPPGSVTRRFQSLLAGAHVERLRFQDLRHAAATVMLVQGVELRVISETLGHSSIGMTADVYDGVVPALGRAAAARMDDALGGRR